MDDNCTVTYERCLESSHPPDLEHSYQWYFFHHCQLHYCVDDISYCNETANTLAGNESFICNETLGDGNYTVECYDVVKEWVCSETIDMVWGMVSAF